VGKKGVVGFDGKKGVPGSNATCILGKRSRNYVGMYT